MKLTKGQSNLNVVGTTGGMVGAAFIALYSILSPQINEVAGKQYEDHAILTASVENQKAMLDDIKDIKRVVYNTAPALGVNPNAGKIASTTNVQVNAAQ